MALFCGEVALIKNIIQFGKEYPDYGIINYNLAALLYDIKEYNNALEYSETAVKFFSKILPANHPNKEYVLENNQAIKKALENQGKGNN